MLDRDPLHQRERRGHALGPETAPLLAVGASSLIWQVASARSIMAGLQGNELTLGLVIGAWLVLTGAGVLLASRVDPRRAPTLLAISLALCPLTILGSVVLQHATLPAYAGGALVAGPAAALSFAALCLAPVCLCLGGCFALTSRLAPASAPVGSWASRLYWLESAGTVCAGLLFHFGLARVSLRGAGLAAGALAWLASFAAACRPERAARRATWGAMLAGGAALLLLATPRGLAGASLLEPRWPGYTLLESRSSPHAALAVLRRGDQVTLVANGQTLFSNQDEERAELEVHLALLCHPAPKRVLLVGGGLGGGLREALKHPIQHLDYVELDPAVVELARRYDKALAVTLADPRVELHLDDGRRLISGARERYDAILIGLPGPSSALLNRFYTEELFRYARLALRPGGLVRVILAGGEGYLSDESLLAHAAILVAMRRALGPVTVLPGQSTFLLGGTGAAPDCGPVTLRRRLLERRLTTRFFTEADVLDRTLPFKTELYLGRVDSVPVRSNTDLQPTAYVHASLLWVAETSPRLARWLSSLAVRPVGSGAPPSRLGRFATRSWLAPLAALALSVLWGMLRRRSVAGGLAIFWVGLCGLTIELAVVLACQELRGVVYHELGLLLTAFMLGTTIGAAAGRKLLTRWPRRALAVAASSSAASSALALASLYVALSWPEAALELFLADLLLAGASVGACYPAASAALAASQGQRAAPHAYAWDLLGAGLGSVLGAGLALPLLGLPTTCAVCAALALGGALTLRPSDK